MITLESIELSFFDIYHTSMYIYIYQYIWIMHIVHFSVHNYIKEQYMVNLTQAYIDKTH